MNGCIVDWNVTTVGGAAGSGAYRGAGIFTNAGTMDVVNCTVADNSTQGLWIGAGTVGRSGRVALYFREDVHLAGPPPANAKLDRPDGEIHDAIRELLADRPAFWLDLAAALGEEMVVDPRWVERLEEMFRSLGRAMSATVTNASLIC